MKNRHKRIGCERFRFYSLSHGAACGCACIVAQSAKTGTGNY